jgi:hypothetical protein
MQIASGRVIKAIELDETLKPWAIYVLQTMRNFFHQPPNNSVYIENRHQFKIQNNWGELSIKNRKFYT